MKIKNIIFDLGGVLLNIDYQRTIDAFIKMGINHFEQYFTQAHQSSLFDKIETGLISPITFFDQLRRLSNNDESNESLTSAWNAMLLDLPAERIELLQEARKNYNIFLLSNTNEIHYKSYINAITKEYNLDFNALFNKAYYSHLIGKRKPDSECFNFVLNENNLIPKETLFIDDSIQHVIGAKKVSINAYHLTDKSILELFDKHGKLII